MAELEFPTTRSLRAPGRMCGLCAWPTDRKKCTRNPLRNGNLENGASRGRKRIRIDANSGLMRSGSFGVDVSVAPIVVDSPDSLKKYAGKEIGVSDWLTVTQERI